MPRKPKTPCRYPGCPALCDGAYCEKHQPVIDHEYNTRHRDRDASRFYSSDRWRKLRAAKLSRNPLCEECARQGRHTPAKMVDHIVPIRFGGRSLDMDNLQMIQTKQGDAKRYQFVWASNSENELNRWFSENFNVEVHAFVENGKYCVVNNTYEPQDTVVYTDNGNSFPLHLEANEIKWYNI